MNEALDETLDHFNLAGLKDLKGQKDLKMARNFRQFDESVATLALIEANNRRTAKYVYRDIADAAAASLTSFTNKIFENARQYGEKIFYEPIIKVAAQEYNITKEHIKPCMDNVENCPDTYKNAYIKLLQPFLINRIPSEGLGFGDFLGYFTPRTISTGFSGSPVQFLNKKSPSDNEHIINNHLMELAKRVSEGELEGISTYELADLLDRPHFKVGSRYQSQYVESRFGCTDHEIYHSAWTKYLSGENLTVSSADGELLTVVLKGPPCSLNDSVQETINILGCCQLSQAYQQHHQVIQTLTNLNNLNCNLMKIKGHS